MKKNIAIFGSSGHVAKGLIFQFAQESSKFKLYLFARNLTKVQGFINKHVEHLDYELLPFNKFNEQKYDVIINCIGFGTPNKVSENMQTLFEVTEHFDNLIIEYLKKNSETLYINLSSGAAYCSEFETPASKNMKSSLTINELQSKDFYGITKMYSEAKHRSLTKLRIIDLRLFGYFSKFIELNSNYFLTELINCIREKKLFATNNINIIRDYSHSYDLFTLIIKIITSEKNEAFDVYSNKEISKFEILNLFENEYNLQYKIDDSLHVASATGMKMNYYSENREANKLEYYPQYTSLECIKDQIRFLI